MNAFELALEDRLSNLRAQGLYRELRHVDTPQGARIKIDGFNCLNFASNDYLGLANEPALKEAACRAIEKFGAGSGSSRLICGSLKPHQDLEAALAEFKGTEAALTFSSGYATALGVLCALLDQDNVIIIDKLVHASIVDAARLCRAKLRVFTHNDLNDLERKLKWAEKRSSDAPVGSRKRRVLIVTESVFSMDGDHAPLRQIVELKERYGAWLMVDEAHATGLYGDQRRGLAEALGVSDRVEIQMGTLGKALGASGGFICGSRRLIDFLVNRSRSFIFSTAPVPAAAAAATAGVQLVQSSEGKMLNEQLWMRAGEFSSAIGHRPSAKTSAIMPIIIGGEVEAVASATQLREKGIFAPAIRYPTVARGAARLRITLTAAHTPADVTELVQALEKNQFVGFKKMEPSLIHLDTPEQVQLAYAEAASAVDFINQSKGQTGVRELLAELNDKPTPEAIEKVYGMSFDAFETKWKGFLKAKGLKPIEGSRVRRLKVRKDQKEDEEVVELREIQSAIARNRTHLADQLLAKGRAAAALSEYQRALQASPQSPVILNKLGRVMVEQNRADEALVVLKKALEIEPDGANTYVQLGRAYHATKQFTEARIVLEEAMQINPYHPLIYRLLIDSYAALGDHEKARQAKTTLEKLAGSN